MRNSFLLMLALSGSAGALTMTYPSSTTTIHERAADWVGAELRGVQVHAQALSLTPGAASGTLTSAPLTVSAFDELVPSWNAVTPGAGSVTVEVRARTGAEWSRWYSFGTWSSAEGRSSVNGQKDASGQIMTDTLRLNARATIFQYRVTLRGAGTTARLVAFATSERARQAAGLGTASNRAAWGKVIDVPGRSQMIYPDGGEVWCSPTSVSMILAARGINVTVPQAAKATYDRAYDGTGNWPFNTAYAAPRAGKAFVTRLRSLREGERFIAAGIPLVASVSFDAGELTGAPITSTAGHLLVIVGFTADGDVVVNDPASETRRGVRRTYDRAQFENVWLPTSGGLVYVIRDAAHPLPTGSPGNW